MSTPPSRYTCRPVVIVPTYQHGQTVAGVVSSVLAGGWTCIVVDDGSTDRTGEALADIHDRHRDAPLVLLRHDHNRGKAAALHTGFEHARKINASHAITLDADGQHDPEQVSELWACAMTHPDHLVLGERPLTVEGGTPWRSRLGRVITNLMIRLQSGVRVSDSQTGFRVYPLAIIKDLPCTHGRYAFETEILIRAGWAGIPLATVPIRSRYFPPAERCSHFRLFADSIHSLQMQATLVIRHSRLRSLAKNLAQRQLLFLPLLVFLLIGAARSGLAPEPRWHPAFAAGSIVGLLVLAMRRRPKFRYNPLPLACLGFLFVGGLGAMLQGTLVYPLIHENYGALRELALHLWVAAVFLLWVVTKPAWLLGVATLPRDSPYLSAYFYAWVLAATSVFAVLLSLALRDTNEFMAGAIPFVFVMTAQGIVRRKAAPAPSSTTTLPSPTTPPATTRHPPLRS